MKSGKHRRNATTEYAIKVVDRAKLKEEDILALKDEVEILGALKDCSHITRLYDFFDEPKTFYLVMEKLSGGELFDRIVQKSYYNEKEARMTCKILLEAIVFCHDRRVAHRDLKPENLLLMSETDDWSIKIADFGFAKVVKEPLSLKTQCGTPVSFGYFDCLWLFSFPPEGARTHLWVRLLVIARGTGVRGAGNPHGHALRRVGRHVVRGGHPVHPPGGLPAVH